jgi:hypothetical protein
LQHALVEKTDFTKKKYSPVGSHFHASGGLSGLPGDCQPSYSTSISLFQLAGRSFSLLV